MDPKLVKQKIAVLAKNHSRLVFNAAYKVLGDIQRAEDITQDVFIKLFNNNHLIKDEVKNWAAYLTTMATRTSLDLLRKLKVRHELSELKSDYQDKIIDPALNPEQQFAFKQDFDSFRYQLTQLSFQEAQVIVLRFLEEFSYQEIADQLEISNSLVGVTLNRGLAKLNQKLGKSQIKGVSYEA